MDINAEGKTAVVTGAGGAIGGALAKGLVHEGASVAIWDISSAAAQKTAEAIGALGRNAVGIACDVLDTSSVEAATNMTLGEFGAIDILVNCAGGSRKEAATSPERTFFDLAVEDMAQVFSLNYMGTVIPCQAVGRIFAERQSGCIVNITSVAGALPLTGTIAYSNAKAAANSFTRWLAVHMAQHYSPRIRVNAIAPGFCLTPLNKYLLVDEKTGAFTDKGQRVIANVPMGRIGEPEEMVGALLWLVSDSARFVTGAVIPVDGGFTAYCGV
ncbi:MAG TPA: SDR family oxidoreductase [Candidatus Hydrogenedentes bacterium]|nr:SDR family oxidoreductase [Candidatus Hydrogenedentota bacterium]